MHKDTQLSPPYHYVSHTPSILLLLRVTGSKIWFPPHNSLHNAISPALNCQDNLYQSRGESPESLSGYSSARQEKQDWGRGIIDIFPRAKPRTPQRHNRAIWTESTWWQGKMETVKWRMNIIRPPGDCHILLFPFWPQSEISKRLYQIKQPVFSLMSPLKKSHIQKQFYSIDIGFCLVSNVSQWHLLYMCRTIGNTGGD